MSLLQQAPRFDVAQAAGLARALFGIEAEAAPLPSERDQNFRLITPAGARFVLKISNATEHRVFVEAQNAALAHVAARVDCCPRVVPSTAGETIAVSPDGAHLVRLVTFLPGEPLAGVAARSPRLLEDLGRRLGRLDAALADFDHPALHRDFHWDLVHARSVIVRHRPLVQDEDWRAVVEQVSARALAEIETRSAAFRRGPIHNDANDWNVLVDGESVSGIIDFGDMVHSWTVADPAVAIAYALLDDPDPLATASQIVRGYQTACPLADDEIAALFPLVCLRLCLSVCLAAWQQQQRPDDEYLTVSQGPIRRTLPGLAAIDPRDAERVLRQACGLAGRGETLHGLREHRELASPAGDTENTGEFSIDSASPVVSALCPRSPWQSCHGLPEPRMTAGEILAARRRLVGRNVSIAYREPLHIVRGSMQYLFDASGRRYLDAYNNVPHVGHCHPRIVEAAHRQMRMLNTNSRYLHEHLVRFAERLAGTLPAPLRVCYFVNSGSEANELALRLARAHTRRRDLIVLDAAYHGNTTTLVEISPYKFNGPGGAGKPDWVHIVPLPDLYRGVHLASDPDAGAKYAAAVCETVERLSADGGGLCAFIAESCPSVGGQIMLPEGYLASVYAAVRSGGGVCIADEVQTAYGRIGTHVYGFEQQGVVPDIVVLGKPIGNGHPIGAVVTTPEIAASFDNGMEFFSTFGGNTVSCAVGLAVLAVLEEERLQAHALAVGDHLLAQLRALADRCPLVGDVRGSGLFLGVELVRDRATREPDPDEASRVVNRMREEGILIGTEGPSHNVLKIRPPMPFSVEDADVLASTLGRVLLER